MEKIIDYNFRDKDILKIALTHKSNEIKKKDLVSNQRYEFLGDAVLELVITKYLFDNYPDMKEGDLTKIRSSAVNTDMLVDVAKEISIGDYLFMSKSEETTGGRKKKSILEDSVEALIAAIYLDGGISQSRKFIKKYFFPKIANLSVSPGQKDYKTRLQELYAKKGKRVIYLDSSRGPDHDKIFFAEAKVDNKVIGKGEGHSKKSAQQSAAKAAVSKTNN